MRLRDATATRAQELLEEALALQERRDSGNDMLTERTEENALLAVQVGSVVHNLSGLAIGLCLSVPSFLFLPPPLSGPRGRGVIDFKI
jgi:hypothetical protein